MKKISISDKTNERLESLRRIMETDKSRQMSLSEVLFVIVKHYEQHSKYEKSQSD